jgi:hypothetical protein
MHYDMEDLLEQANEIQETMARSYAVPDEIDEDELQAGKPLPCANLIPGTDHILPQNLMLSLI